MRRDLAEQMITHLRELEAPMNRLSAASEQLEGDERTRVRRSVAQVIATVGALKLDIAKQYPDLASDKAP
jgi:hypothetical protein